MARRSGRLLLGFILGGLLLGGLGFLTAGFTSFNPSEWSDRFKPIIPEPDDDEDDTTTDPTGTDDITDPTDSTDPGDVTDPTIPDDEDPLFTVDDFLALPRVDQNAISYDSFNTNYFLTAYEAAGLSKSVYRSAENGTIPQTEVPVSYNSLKIKDVYTVIEDDDEFEYGPYLQFGFPGTLNETHTDNEFMNGKNYSSYLTINGLFEIEDARLDFMLTEGLFLFYRTELNLEWQVSDPNNDYDRVFQRAGFIEFHNDEELVQVAIAFAGNNKSKNQILDLFLVNTLL